jgi:hypothetical protein
LKKARLFRIASGSQQREFLAQSASYSVTPWVLSVIPAPDSQVTEASIDTVSAASALGLFERFEYKLNCNLYRPSGERLSVMALAFTMSKLFDVEGVYEAVGQLVQHS